MGDPVTVRNNRMDIIRILRHPQMGVWSPEMKNKMNEEWKNLKPHKNNKLLANIEEKLGMEYVDESMPGSPPFTVDENTRRIKLIEDHLGMKAGGRKIKKRKTRRKKKKRKTRKAKHRRKKKTRRRKRGGHASILH